jgi:inosine-uridine nucleoside N-ribohydrolase
MKSFFALLMAGLVLNANSAKIILDTDMSNDCDDAGALAVLHALADRGEAEILAVVTNRKGTDNAAAAAVSAINHFYGRPEIPIGTDKDGGKTPNPKPSSYTPALRDEFRHSARPDHEMPDSLAIYRRTLARQDDRSVILCSIGLLSNLEDLLKSGPDEQSPLSGKDLIRKKVKLTVVMGGTFPRTSTPETNLRLDPRAAMSVAEGWPTPVYWQGYDVGAAIITGAGLKNTRGANPVRRAFELRPFGPGFSIDKGKPSHDQAAVILAVRGARKGHWRLSEWGQVTCDEGGFSEWVERPGGLHRLAELDGSERMLQAEIERLMATPPTRP